MICNVSSDILFYFILRRILRRILIEQYSTITRSGDAKHCLIKIRTKFALDYRNNFAYENGIERVLPFIVVATTVKLANSASPFKFRQVNFCCYECFINSVNCIQFLFVKTHFIIHKTSFL